MRYAQIREMDISNGEGIGVSLFVQGCHFHCRGCFNPETWDFNGGKLWTKEAKEKFIELAGRDYVKRISILGGEPLADENIVEVIRLLNELSAVKKQIWLYTGYKWEDIVNDLVRSTICDRVNVIVDGQFEIENQDLHHDFIVYAGSTNQRIIDVQKSLAKGEVVLYE